MQKVKILLIMNLNNNVSDTEIDDHISNKIKISTNIVGVPFECVFDKNKHVLNNDEKHSDIQRYSSNSVYRDPFCEVNENNNYRGRIKNESNVSTILFNNTKDISKSLSVKIDDCDQGNINKFIRCQLLYDFNKGNSSFCKQTEENDNAKRSKDTCAFTYKFNENTENTDCIKVIPNKKYHKPKEK